MAQLQHPWFHSLLTCWSGQWLPHHEPEVGVWLIEVPHTCQTLGWSCFVLSNSSVCCVKCVFGYLLIVTVRRALDPSHLAWRPEGPGCQTVSTFKWVTGEANRKFQKQKCLKLIWYDTTRIQEQTVLKETSFWLLDLASLPMFISIEFGCAGLGYLFFNIELT